METLRPCEAIDTLGSMGWHRALDPSLLLALCVSATGCNELKIFVDGEQQKPFPVLIRIERDPGNPLPDVPILYQGKEVKRTSADGTALLELHKPDGANVELTIGCPPDTRPADPLKLFVRRVEGQKYTEQRMYCRPSMRRIAVAVRADDGPRLPVTYLGQVVATTDESGAAHFAMSMPPGETIKVAIDASANKKMFPQREEALFRVGEQDEVFLFYKKFTVEKKPARYVPRRTGPKRL